MSDDATPPWGEVGLHSRVAHQEGLQHIAERRISALEEGHEVHAREIATLKEIANELKTMNTTLSSIKDEIKDPLKFYNRYSAFKDGLTDIGKFMIFVSALIVAYHVVFPKVAQWLTAPQSSVQGVDTK